MGGEMKTTSNVPFIFGDVTHVSIGNFCWSQLDIGPTVNKHFSKTF